MVRVAVRGGPVVEATLNATDAEPFPFAFEVIEIQSTSDVAVHVHKPLDGRTSTLPVPPALAIDAALLDSSNLHSPAACATCAR
jgi:hypothetical protein